MTKHLLITAALAAGLVFANAPRVYAFSPFGLMAALASDSDADELPARPDNAADATAHNDSAATDAEEFGDDGLSAAATAAPAAREAAQAKYIAATEPAGR